MTALATPPKLQFLDSNGAPLVGGKLYTYAAGTTTPLTTYTDFGGVTANANPVILDSRGEASVWLGTSLYKMALYSATDVLIWTVDNIDGFATLTQLTALQAQVTTLQAQDANLTALVSINGGQIAGLRNRVMNGAMAIDQRNGGGLVTPATGDYLTDRWQYAGSQASKVSAVRATGSGLTGFPYTLKFTSLSAYAVTTTDYFVVRQKVEGFNVADLAWGTASAKTVTISFWVNSSLTGTFGGMVLNNAADRSYGFTYTVNSAGTWEYKTVTIAGDTSGAWLTDSNIGINIMFGLGAGATQSKAAGSWGAGAFYSVTGAVSVVGTNAATWYISGVQLEVGSVATTFEQRPYGMELALCQRYTLVIPESMFFGTGTNRTGGASQYMHVPTPSTMRTAPAFTYTSLSIYCGDAAVAGVTVSTVSLATNGLWIGTASTAVGLYQGAVMLYTTTGTCIISSEL